MQKGRSHQLLKKAVLKNSKEAKLKEDLKNKKLLESIPSLYDQIEELKEKLYRKEEELKGFEDDSLLLKQLHKQGYIDSEGNPIVND